MGREEGSLRYGPFGCAPFDYGQGEQGKMDKQAAAIEAGLKPGTYTGARSERVTGVGRGEAGVGRGRRGD